MKQNWEIKKLSEVLKIQNGYAFDAKLFTIEKGTPLIRIRDIKEGVGTVTNFNGKYDKKYEVNAGDFLIGMDGEFGCYEWKGDTALLNQRVCRLQEFSNKLYPRFLFYGINKYLKAIENVTAFATVKHISSKQIENIEIPLPPLSEQQRIVVILDEAFAAIAAAKANAEQNLKNAKELFESYLQGVFENMKAKGQLYPLANYLELITYGFTNPMPTADEGPYMVTAKNVKGGIVDYETSRRTSQDAFDNLITDKCRPKKGDVLLTKDGTLGRLAVVEKANMCINQSVALLRPIKDLNSYYLKELLSSQYYQKLMVEQAGGATIKHIYITRVDKMLVPVPAIKEQLIIIQKLEALSAETKRLETIYQSKINDLQELKKSVLQRAFSGELKQN